MGFRERLKSPKAAATFMSILMYACIIGVNVEPEVQEKMAEAFGEAPFGLPVVFVVSVAQTILYLPMPWVFLHAMRIAVRAREEGRHFGIFYMMTAVTYHPDLHRSLAVCAFGLVYFMMIVGAWIIYADSRGI